MADKIERLLMRPSEAAELLSISRSKAYELIAAGVIPSVRIGGMLRIPIAVLRRISEGATPRLLTSTTDEPEQSMKQRKSSDLLRS